VERLKQWMRATPAIVAGLLLIFPQNITRQLLLWAVQLLEAWHLVVSRWIGIPLLEACGLAEYAQGGRPNMYHYHDLRDAIADKLGAGWKYWRNRSKR
jgi:hypothetical protein